MVCLFVEMEVVRVDTAIQSKDELISLVRENQIQNKISRKKSDPF